MARKTFYYTNKLLLLTFSYPFCNTFSVQFLKDVPPCVTCMSNKQQTFRSKNFVKEDGACKIDAKQM